MFTVYYVLYLDIVRCRRRGVPLQRRLFKVKQKLADLMRNLTFLSISQVLNAVSRHYSPV